MSPACFCTSSSSHLQLQLLISDVETSEGIAVGPRMVSAKLIEAALLSELLGVSGLTRKASAVAMFFTLEVVVSGLLWEQV